ncbi:hypothetical protein GCM10022268_36510 [Sphingomonas cynarae]|uniref:Probable membrane transporter protein n=1 Tax=Sphingomonas cynarae TaxID=930197 RepID=A0ABP7EWI4_9SPHN
MLRQALVEEARWIDRGDSGHSAAAAFPKKRMVKWDNPHSAFHFTGIRRFLIVPGLILATAMPLPFAIGTSLVVVSALGLTTATSYAMSGLVDWSVTALLVAGGVIGTIGGIALGKVLGTRKGLLERGFAAVVIAIGTYITTSSI